MLDKDLDIKFIIADDDVEILRMHRDIVKSLHPENKIYEFLNGFEAISFLEAKSLGDNWKADEWVVISDFYMPIKNGGQVMKFVVSKNISKYIIVSSAKSEDLLQKMIDDYAFEYKGNILKKGDHSNELLVWLKQKG